MQHPHKIQIGISSCLIGREVRFDGSHKRDGWIVQSLGEYFEFLPFCPEVGIGLGVPRPPIHLIRNGQSLAAVNIKDHSLDHTLSLQQYAQSVVLPLQNVSGFILKKNSPSCGMERVKVYNSNKPNLPPERNGIGIFAQQLQQLLPLLPLEEEGRLCDPILRENFIGRIYVYHRWQTLNTIQLTPARLVNFHADHKYIFMAHDQHQAKILGNLVAQAGVSENLTVLAQDYIRIVMQMLAKPVSRGQHSNVLYHLLGYLRNHLDAQDRQEMVELIEQYQTGLVPLIVPITLLKHHFKHHPQPYIERQHYLNPHPGELMLRNLL